MSRDLEDQFLKVFNEISDMKQGLAPDEMLKLYAFYKQAIAGDTYSYDDEIDVRSAFKFNAWTQLKGMSEKEAKKQYIKLAENILIVNQESLS